MNSGLNNTLCKILKIEPTVFLKERDNILQQLVRLTLENSDTCAGYTITVKLPGKQTHFHLGTIPEGQSVHEIFIDEMAGEAEVEFILKCNGEVADTRSVSWRPPRHWTVHVVQTSHHDPGYTDLPSAVLKQHDAWLDNAIDYAEETGDYPEDARFRIVIEQTWSVDHFIKNAPGDRVARIIDLMRSGQFEATALFGNMTSELCGHETLIRSLYHAARLKRLYGIPVVSAEHNDITGISWGVSRILTDAGIRIFCPGIPLYYDWSKLKLQSFWDAKAIFSHEGPGAFWWEAPTGKRILFWCNNSGCGGDPHTTLPGLADKLQELEEGSYPYSIMRWPVNGAQRDNSPYVNEFSHSIREWNQKWAFPHLICSTNAIFYMDFIKQLPPDLPVFRGELAGQDYPIGAMSTAEATAVNRNNHNGFLTAEKLSTAAEVMAGHNYENELLFETQEEVLMHDEHAWGFHFPCGPAMKASEYEKALNSFKASAHIHQLTRKAIAGIADNIRNETGEIQLVVFNPASYARSGPVSAPMREFDNTGGTISRVLPENDPVGTGYLWGVSLNDRWPVHPPLDIVNGCFELVENETGEKIPFQILPVEPSDTVPFAAQRAGVGSGSSRLGYFDYPLGVKMDLCFIARDIPALGYRTYTLVPAKAAPVFENRLKTDNGSIENEYYRVSFDTEKGRVIDIYDKTANRSLLDSECPHSFGSLVVRDPWHKEYRASSAAAVVKSRGPVCVALEITSSVYGHPTVTCTIRLYAGIRQIFLETRILKDSTPLLDAHLAFPFLAHKPEFRYEGSLSVMEPIKDYLPGSYSDTIAVQNWVKVRDGDHNILWSAVDAPIAGFSDLWPGYISPAHRCVIDESAKHPPLRPEDLNRGWIYSNIFHNNFGTNFSVSQVGDVLFRYVITTMEGEVSDGRAAAFGWQAVTPLEQIFTKKPTGGSLPVTGSFLSVDNENTALLTFKKAEDSNGYVLRLWNMSDDIQKVSVRLNFMKIRDISLINLAEENPAEENLVKEEPGGKVAFDDDSFSLTVDKREIVNVRVIADIG